MAPTNRCPPKTPTPDINLCRLALKESQSIRIGLRRHLDRMRALEFDVDIFETSDAGPASTVEMVDRNLMRRLDEIDRQIIGSEITAEKITKT
jgi:hypothetical protein